MGCAAPAKKRRSDDSTGSPEGRKIYVSSEFYKVRAQALLSKKVRAVICYEYDKNVLKDVAERI
jgi:hypothetical protein